MASIYFFHVLGHVYLAAHTAHDDADVAAALKAGGFGADKVKKGIDIGELAENLLQRKMIESPDNKTLGHNIHAAVAEVEMWLQAVKIKLRKAGFSADELKVLLGKSLHAHDHTVTAIVQGLRAVGMLRTLSDEVVASLGERVVHDMIMRGNTLLKKLYKVADEFVTPNSMISRDAQIIVDIDKTTDGMVALLAELDAAATKSSASGKFDVNVFGKAGWLPFGVGMPGGGAALSVVRHQRAKTSAPDPRQTVRTSGWSVGRQGNKENLGNGWIESEVGSVMKD